MTNMGRSEKAVGALMNRKNGEHSTVPGDIPSRLSDQPVTNKKRAMHEHSPLIIYIKGGAEGRT